MRRLRRLEPRPLVPCPFHWLAGRTRPGLARREVVGSRGTGAFTASTPTPKYPTFVTSTRDVSSQTLVNHAAVSNPRSARDQRSRAFFPGGTEGWIHERRADPYHHLSNVLDAPKSWSGASDADCDCQRERSDNGWAGKAPFLHSHDRRHSS